MEIIDVLAIEQNALKIEVGIKKYMKIMNSLHSCDVSQDREFQVAYNGFYRVRQRSQEWYKIYYGYMQRHKSDSIEFKDVLIYMFEKTGKFEPSFSSKLLATINPDMPVWDGNVLSQLSIKAPQCDKKDRLEATIEKYTDLGKWYDTYLKTKNSQDVVDRFDKLFPNTQITDLKKIDLALWSMGLKK